MRRINALFLEALALLNHFLKSNKSDMTVVAFLIFPTKTNNFNVDSLKGQAIANQLREAVDRERKYLWLL